MKILAKTLPRGESANISLTPRGHPSMWKNGTRGREPEYARWTRRLRDSARGSRLVLRTRIWGFPRWRFWRTLSGTLRGCVGRWGTGISPSTVAGRGRGRSLGGGRRTTDRNHRWGPALYLVYNPYTCVLQISTLDMRHYILVLRFFFLWVICIVMHIRNNAFNNFIPFFLNNQTHQKSKQK